MLGDRWTPRTPSPTPRFVRRQHVSSLREPARFDAWFSRILVNVCRDRLRERHDGPAVLGFDPPVRMTRSRNPSSARRCGRRWRRSRPSSGGDRAPYLEGMTVEQIAEHVGAREGTVKSRLHYGVAELRAAYDAASRDPETTLP